MNEKAEIKEEILDFVEGNSILFTRYSNWYVGITNNPSRRDKEHGNRKIWKVWRAGSPGDAREIEMFFLAEGMKGGKLDGTSPDFVYVYKRSGPSSKGARA